MSLLGVALIAWQSGRRQPQEAILTNEQTDIYQ
jgi:hypothetical protein